MKILLAASAAFAALALPAGATAALASMTTRDIPLHGERTLAAAAPARFDLVGLRWRGSGTVSFRVRSPRGHWGAWIAAAPEAEDLPDRDSREARASRGWRLGNPTWVGPSPASATASPAAYPLCRPRSYAAPSCASRCARSPPPERPPIVPRSGWGADETLRRHAPQYADTVRLAIVHHTAGPNDYSPAQAAAIMRGIELYHVKANGWNDIGYNFLVDRYGTVYEGRYGGVDKNVVGAHAKGSTPAPSGVAVIGSFSGGEIPRAAASSLTRLLAWRLDLAHVDPLSTLTFISGGSERFPAGIPVFLRAVSGHRDTGSPPAPATSSMRSWVPFPARRSRSASRSCTSPMSRVAWEASCASAPVCRARCRGASASQTRSAPHLPRVPAPDPPSTGRGMHRAAAARGASWRITVAGATPIEGVSVEPSPTGGALAITASLPTPRRSAPTTTVSRASTITTRPPLRPPSPRAARRRRAANRELSPRHQPPGEHTLSSMGSGSPTGCTRSSSLRRHGGPHVTRQAKVDCHPDARPAAVAPAVFSPDGDGKGDTLVATFQLGAPATVHVRVLRAAAGWRRRSAGFQAGPQSVGWDGSKRVGTPRRPLQRDRRGDRRGRLDAITLPFLTDANAPVVRAPRRRPPRLRVSEPATLTVSVNGSSGGRRKAGRSRPADEGRARPDPRRRRA